MRTWLIKMREQHGLSQAQVAKAVGISQPTYWEYEKGKSTPKPERAKQIARLLGFDWTAFYTEDSTHAHDDRP